MKVKHQRLVKDTVLTLIALVIFGSTNFLFNVVIGRVYGSAYLGMVSTALSTALLLSYIVSTSFPGAVSKYVSEYLGRNRKREASYVLEIALKYGVAIGLITTIFALIFSEQLCHIFHMPRDLFALTLPLILLYGLYMILKMAYYGYRNVEKYFKNEVVADSLFFLALGMIAIFHAQGFVYIPYLLLYSYFILSALYFFRDKLLHDAVPQKKELQKKFFTFAGISFVGTFSSMAMRSLSIMLSSRYVSHSEVGYLAAAFSISTIFFLFPNAIGRVLMPEFSFTFGKGDKESLIKLLNRSTEYLAVFVTLVNSIGILIAWPIIEFFYGTKFLPSVILLQLALVLYWPSMAGRAVLSVLSGTRYVHIPNIISVLGLVFGVILWIILIPIFGVVGTATGYIIESWIAMSFTFYFGKKYFNFNHMIIIKNFFWIFIILLIQIVNYIPYLWRVSVSLVVLLIYILINKKIFTDLLRKFRDLFV